MPFFRFNQIVFNSIEVEIKSWLKSEFNAIELQKKLTRSGWILNKTNSQLNHYFVGDNFFDLKAIEKDYFVSPDAIEKLNDILKIGSNFSLRTRKKNDKSFLIIKVSTDNTSSSNGITRLEFEEEVSIDLLVLDEILLDFGFVYQAKWSRFRQEFQNSSSPISICIDKNAGYGYLAEFEQLTKTDDLLEIKSNILSLMKSFDLEELDQKLLAKMFEHYNNNWLNYYNTDNTFTEKDLTF
jgi:hypothetical protein